MYKLEMKGINKSFRNNKVLKNMKLSLFEGERLSILGPSGCGKSTMLGIMAGIVDDFEGEILLNGRDISNLASNKRNIVIVSQENLLFPHMNVYDNIGFGLKIRKKDKKFIEKKVKILLEEIKLVGYENKKVSKLSGGEKQRVALARALAVEPELLLLDEAYSSLDTHLREKMRELTIRLQEKHNITTILVTHDKQEALLFSDRVGVMLDGEIKQIDTPQKIYEKPNNFDIASFMLDDNFIEIEGKKLFIKPEEIKILESDKKEDLDLLEKNQKLIESREEKNSEINNSIIINYIDAILESSNYSGVSVKHIVKVNKRDLYSFIDKEDSLPFSNNRKNSFPMKELIEEENRDFEEEFISLKVEDFSKKTYEKGDSIVLKIENFIIY
ncbi:ABC transporter ATP-binding protein [Peptostreptococcus russellii]|uniref:ABC transporter ATP-binding protein n=1 Tax=Peptostreptococcus russellii TaxID=215200 RepID=UPI003F5890DE